MKCWPKATEAATEPVRPLVAHFTVQLQLYKCVGNWRFLHAHFINNITCRQPILQPSPPRTRVAAMSTASSSSTMFLGRHTHTHGHFTGMLQYTPLPLHGIDYKDTPAPTQWYQTYCQLQINQTMRVWHPHECARVQGSSILLGGSADSQHIGAFALGMSAMPIRGSRVNCVPEHVSA